jgi:hypothetical protein
MRNLMDFKDTITYAPLCSIQFASLYAVYQPNISLTFKSAPERSEGLAWFVLFILAQTMTKDLQG